MNDSGFESGVAELPTPLDDPPMSGTVGGWRVERSAQGIITGLTVPRIGIVTSAWATEGSHVGRVLFVVGIVASASFSQELNEGLAPATRYKLLVDVGTTELASVVANAAVRVYAGETLIATSEDPTFLRVVDLNEQFDTFVLEFCSGSVRTPGNLRIELVGESTLGVLSGVAFDNVRLEANAFNCPCNVNADCVLNSQDFFDYLTLFFALDPRADSNGDGVLNSQGLL